MGKGIILEVVEGCRHCLIVTEETMCWRLQKDVNIVLGVSEAPLGISSCTKTFFPYCVTYFVELTIIHIMYKYIPSSHHKELMRYLVVNRTIPSASHSVALRSGVTSSKCLLGPGNLSQQLISV